METLSEPRVAPVAPAPSRGVTPRVVVLCLALALFFGLIIPLIDVKMSNTFLGATHFPPGAIMVLLVLVALNPLARLVSRRLPLERNELLTVYISCLFSCLVPGHGSENFFVPNLVGPFYFATRENGWLEWLAPNLKAWFTPALAHGGNEAVQNWYSGATVGQVFIPWGAWIVPLVAWGALILASYFMLACLSVMLRAQWARREALTFPLLRLPLEMTANDDAPRSAIGSAFFRNGLMWCGFGIAFSIQLLRGLHVYFADVPDFPLSLDLAPYFSESPWNQIGWTPLNIYPIAIGVTYLLTSEISFSLWAFYWIIKFQYIAASMSGFQPSILPDMISSGHKLFAGMQIVGAYFAYVALLLWTGREHLRHVVRRALGREKATPDESGEALSYPLAFWGFTFCFAFCVAWCVVAGVSPLVALWMWTAYLVAAIGLSRIIAEGGVLFVQQGWLPLSAFAHLFGAGPGTALPATSIVPASFVQMSLIGDMRGFLMPSFVQSFKLASDRGIAARPLLRLIGAVTLLGFVVGVWMNVRLGYQQGGLSLEWWFSKGGPQNNADNIASMIRGLDAARAPSLANWFWLSVGAAATLGMMLARARFMWFPLHPIGYLLCLSYAMNRLWFSILLGWGFKVVLTRFGGGESYRRVTPFFLGLILGDVVAMIFWLALDGWQGKMVHQLMPS